MLLDCMALHRSVIAITAALAWSVSASAADWPQWRGEHRDGVWSDTGIVKTFPVAEMPRKWSVPVGLGYSGPAVANGRVFVTDYLKTAGMVANDPAQRTVLNGDERVLCLDEQTGKVLWEHRYARPYSISYPGGPRCTPTVDGDRVYTLGAEGNLLCLQTSDGKVVWSKDFPKDYHAMTPIWGYSGHPLVEGEKLICIVGGEGSIAVAFDKRTGKELWKNLSASEQGYAPPSIIDAAGIRQLLIWDADKLHSLNPDTGALYWEVPLKPDYAMSIMTPQQEGNLLFASGIGDVAAVIELDDKHPDARIIWKGNNKTTLGCANSTPLVKGGVVYGCDCKTGQFRAVKLLTGEPLWATFAPTTNERRGRHGTAFIVANGDRDFLFSETGDLIIAHLTPDRYDEISRTHLLKPTGNCFGRDVVWTHPAFANKCVFARNDEELICVDLGEK